jgi:hypothetical protein
LLQVVWQCFAKAPAWHHGGAGGGRLRDGGCGDVDGGRCTSPSVLSTLGVDGSIFQPRAPSSPVNIRVTVNGRSESHVLSGDR